MVKCSITLSVSPGIKASQAEKDCLKRYIASFMENRPGLRQGHIERDMKVKCRSSVLARFNGRNTTVAWRNAPYPGCRVPP